MASDPRPASPTPEQPAQEAFGRELHRELCLKQGGQEHSLCVKFQEMLAALAPPAQTQQGADPGPAVFWVDPGDDTVLVLRVSTYLHTYRWAMQRAPALMLADALRASFPSDAQTQQGLSEVEPYQAPPGEHPETCPVPGSHTRTACNYFRAELSRYGRHLHGCTQAAGACSCGLIQALLAQPLGATFTANPDKQPSTSAAPAQEPEPCSQCEGRGFHWSWCVIATGGTSPPNPPAAQPASPEGALREALDAARDALNIDRTGLAAGLNEVKLIAKGYRWLPNGEWGSYSWEHRSEETLRKEVGWMIDGLDKAADAALHASGALADKSVRAITAALAGQPAREDVGCNALIDRDTLELAKDGGARCSTPNEHRHHSREDDQKALRAARGLLRKTLAPLKAFSDMQDTYPGAQHEARSTDKLLREIDRALAGSPAGEGREDNQELLGKKGEVMGAPVLIEDDHEYDEDNLGQPVTCAAAPGGSSPARMTCATGRKSASTAIAIFATSAAEPATRAAPSIPKSQSQDRAIKSCLARKGASDGRHVWKTLRGARLPESKAAHRARREVLSAVRRIGQPVVRNRPTVPALPIALLRVGRSRASRPFTLRKANLPASDRRRVMRYCRVPTGKVHTGSTYAEDGDWIEHYAETYCNADLVRGKCPIHPPAKRAARSAPKKPSRPQTGGEKP